MMSAIKWNLINKIFVTLGVLKFICYQINKALIKIKCYLNSPSLYYLKEINNLSI